VTPRAVQAMRAAGALAILLSGCHKRPGAPSAHYDKGAAIYHELYVRELDDAWLDPKMEGAVAELILVEPDSVSAPAAKELLAQIEKGRQDAKAARDARAKALAASQRAPAIDPGSILAASEPPPSDAGERAGANDPYGPGASIADINAQSGGCLVAGSAFREEGSGKTGATYKLAEDPACRTQLPGFVGQVVLALEGRIYRRVGATEVKTEKTLPGGPLAGVDGGAPTANPAVPPSSLLTQAPALRTPDAQPPAGPPTAPIAGPSANVAREQNATPSPSVVQEQNATPTAPPPPSPAAPVDDATPPPAQ